MPVVNVNLVLDDAAYVGVKAGTLELCGMVKDQTHRIKKHLPTVVDAAEDGAVKAIDIVREHNKKGVLIICSFIVAGGTIAGTVAYFAQKGNQNWATLSSDISMPPKLACSPLKYYIISLMIWMPLLN